MEGHLYSHIFSFPKRIAGRFFMLYVDHFSHIPQGDPWDSAFGYAKEVSSILYDLARRAQVNVMLVGQEGVGSLGIAKEVATQMKTHPDLRNSKVLFVHIDELLAGAVRGIDQLHAISKTVSEIERLGNAVVVLLGMKNVFAGKYAVSAEDVLHPFFSSSSVRTITILSDEEYHEHIASHAELAPLARVVKVAGLSAEKTKQFLKKTFDRNIPHEFLDEVVEKTHGIFSHIPYPKRAITIAQELITEGAISKEHVHHYVSSTSGVDNKRLQDAHALNLEEVISRHVVNQKHAIQDISRAMARARNKGIDTKHPLASLLFAGSRGVGKTETAQAIAQAYFGSTARMMRLDMENISEGLPKRITEHPFSVLLLTGLEQASDAAQAVLKSVLTDGYIADRFGRKYFTTHMIIIATSNIEGTGLYDEDFLASFDGVIQFAHLEPGHVREIARRMLARFNGRLQIEHDVSLHVTEELVEYLASNGHSEEFGAHTMREVMQKTIEETALHAISKGKVVPGGKIVIDPKQLG